MTYVYETIMGGNELVVEYVFSSVSNDIKVVEMSANGEYHRLNWMSKENQLNLLNDLERDYLDNHSTMSHPDFDDAMNGTGPFGGLSPEEMDVTLDEVLNVSPTLAKLL